MARNRSCLDGGKARKVLEKTRGKCFYCECELPADRHDYDWDGKIVVTYRQWDVDHVQPVCKGGSNHIDNLVPSCKRCNSKKGAK